MHCVMFENDEDNDVWNVDIYEAGYPVDATKYVDFEYEVHAGTPDMMIAEILQHNEYGVRINFEGGNPDMAEVGHLFKLLIENEVDLITLPW